METPILHGVWLVKLAVSNDLRRRIIDRIQANQETQPEIAEHFTVSLPFVEKLWYRFRTTGSFQALPHGGGKSSVGFQN